MLTAIEAVVSHAFRGTAQPRSSRGHSDQSTSLYEYRVR